MFIYPPRDHLDVGAVHCSAAPHIGRNVMKDSPPIGLSVYETYGKSESEQTLVGGETGLESGYVDVDLGSSWAEDRRRSVTAIVFPRCNRVVPAPVAVLGRP